MVVGEYARDYGFSLPKPVSIYREYLRLRLQVEWYMQTLQNKKEVTWYKLLKYFRY